MEWQGLGNEVQFQGYTEYVGWFVKKLTGFQRKYGNNILTAF